VARGGFEVFTGVMAMAPGVPATVTLATTVLLDVSIAQTELALSLTT
jgi:hypothetical protein